jgi:hypothetical protein
MQIFNISISLTNQCIINSRLVIIWIFEVEFIILEILTYNSGITKIFFWGPKIFKKLLNTTIFFLKNIHIRK